MSRFLTAAQVAGLWHTPIATVRWLAHRDRWERTEDNRRPVLYRAQDVEQTMDARQLDNCDQGK